MKKMATLLMLGELMGRVGRLESTVTEKASELAALRAEFDLNLKSRVAPVVAARSEPGQVLRQDQVEDLLKSIDKKTGGSKPDYPALRRVFNSIGFNSKVLAVMPGVLEAYGEAKCIDMTRFRCSDMVGQRTCVRWFCALVNDTLN